MGHGDRVTPKFRRPPVDQVSRDDLDLWCVLMDGNEENLLDCQCENCGHAPEGGEGHSADMEKLRWYCAGCGGEKKILPRVVEVPPERP